MPWTNEPNKEGPFLLRAPKRRRIFYPTLPSILDDDTLSAVSTLESEELAFAIRQGRGRSQYLHALYLKAMSVLGHSRFDPKDLPRQFRQRIVEQLRCEDEFLRILAIDRGEKSHIVSAVRTFLGLGPMTREGTEKVLYWLQNGPAKKESDIAVLVNAAIDRFREMRVEIPSWKALQSMAQQALSRASAIAIEAVNQGFDADEGERLDSLLIGKDGKTLFDFLKNPVPQATANNLAKELQRIERLQSLLGSQKPFGAITRHQLEQFAQLARRYTAPELAQLSRQRRRTLLFCFIVDRLISLLDAAGEMIIRVWDNTKQSATTYAGVRQLAAVAAVEANQEAFSELLSIIHRSRSPEDLWGGIYQFKTREQYHGIMNALRNTPSWNSSYLDKIEDYYPTFRRFLPDWYRLVPLSATTADEAIPRAQTFAREHATSNQTELPVENCPVEFLTPPWENKALKRYGRTGRIVRVLKAPFELGLLDATVQGLKNHTVAITGARRHAPMIDHLLPREEFLERVDEHASRLGLPATAAEYYTPRRARLEKDLEDFDRNYHAAEDKFWINRNGTLGFSRVPGETLPHRLKRIRSELTRKMPEVSIFDILLDCQRLTGFMDVFKPASGRQNMSEEERLRHLLAAFYAYGCNCGPGQAARALQIQKNQVVYMRRRYMTTQNLMEAAAILAHAYQQTSVAQRLGEMSVLLTDSMQMRTLKQSLIARQHHRYLSGKSTLLYQHITSSCVCLFTQALLCNVSEAIHMLAGVMECRNGREPLINICDSAGKSNLVFGLSGLLNILLYPRVRSRHLKLWGTGETAKYKNIATAIAGKIRHDRMDKGWQDIIWILASIETGTAKPSVILNHLAQQPQHPAAQGLEELGKLDRSSYLLRYGRDMEMRRFVAPETCKREHWNKFTGEVQAFGDLIREKTLEDQEEIFWFLTIVQDAIVLWDALMIDHILRSGLMVISEADLKHMLPTMTENINFIGKFDVDFLRRPPFELMQMIRQR